MVAVASDRIERHGHPSHAATHGYLRAVAKAAQALPLMLPALGDALDADTLIATIDGIVLTGSPSNVDPARYGAPQPHAPMLLDRDRDAAILPLLPRLIDAGVPVLGICRGFQELNVIFGGTLNPAVHELPGALDHREGDHGRPIDRWYDDSHEFDIVPGARSAIRGSERMPSQFPASPGHRAPGSRPARRGESPGRTWWKPSRSRARRVHPRGAMAPRDAHRRQPVCARHLRCLWRSMPCASAAAPVRNGQRLTSTPTPSIKNERHPNHRAVQFPLRPGCATSSCRLRKRVAWPVDSHLLPVAGAQGETLATDVVLDGPADASRMLVVISGVHGVEGFCGSAIQTGMLRIGRRDGSARHVAAIRARSQSLRFLAPAPRDAGKHRPQPQLRRLLQAASDQCRLWRDPRPAAAGAVATAAGRRGPHRPVPRTPRRSRPAACDVARPAQPSRRPALRRLGAGVEQQASFARILRRYAAQVRQLASIDIHTGLGPYGVGERIFASMDEDPAVLAMRQALVGRADLGHHRDLQQHSIDGADPDAQLPRNARRPGTSASAWSTAPIRWSASARPCAQSTGCIATAAATRHKPQAIKQEMKDAFYPDAPDWKHAVWQQGSQACLQAMRGLQEDASLAALAA